MAGKQYSLKAVLSVTDKLSPALKRVDCGIGKIGRSFAGISRASKSLASSLATPLLSLSALAGAGGFSLTGAISQFTELGKSVNDASKKTGASVEALQKLQFAAKRGGLSTEEMTKAMAKLSSTMGNALSGKSAEAATLFKRLGINLRDANGQIVSSADVMRGLAEAIKRNENPAVRMRILTTIFGEQMARNLIPMLVNGAEGLDEMATKAEKLGIIIGKETAEQASHLGDVLGDFGLVLKSLQVRIAAQLAPIIEKITLKFQNWIVANKEFIAQRVEKIFDGLAKAIDSVDFSSVLDGFLRFVEYTGKAIDAVGGIGNVIKGFGLLIGASLLGDLFKLGKALYGLGGAFAAAFGPWGVLAAGAVAAGIAIYENWDTIREKLAAVWEWIADKYEKFTKFLSAPLEGIRNLAGPGSYQAPAVSGMGGQVAGVAESKMTGDISVRIVSDRGTKAEVEKVDASGGRISVEPQTYGLLTGD